ncbi:hypothetical protein FE810_04505 [Thalassotalea litorea]|uniref:Uncharacterized protein n=1 Tax=Thalassotalea litorea TaxID=2020715 RepID=A0A5R9IML7_9GAMM|nr:hypothetical protein [Thalassotalea litorea]TLU66775.1 hypothetical protein FE810_04505 [Thalassotalea litorea]
MKSSHLMALLPFVLTLGACKSTPELSFNPKRFDSPEVYSQPLKVNIATGFTARSLIVIDRYEDLNDHTIDSQVREKNYGDDEVILFASADVTAGNGWEFSLSGADSLKAAVKYQFYGEHSENSDIGNLSQAVTLGYERHQKDEADWHQKSDIIDIAWVVGYRALAKGIIYGGPFIQWGKADGQVNAYELSPETGDRFLAEEINFSRNGTFLGLNIAYEHRFNFGLGWGIEFVTYTNKWGDDDKADQMLNLMLDYQF